ncbi:CocE/NonD family hydrolase [Methylobacterium organophilum]|uniref:Cocaine esterase n=1 Tax=Methylobacterium organophilum TaxID=410 RepID=A0ABQ4TFK9_METOR|nr:CocE/NonD family hydrolase [Methylobacterium organophilum]GJE29147.1 Cocaine esterase [Methylobacterium organophilum]
MAAETPLAVAGPESVELRLADGVSLVADIYRPAGPGRHPVMLMRQPYGRAIASTLTLAHPAWYAAQGYVVVVQDVRGRGGSGGDFRLFEHEAEDGAQTLAWAAELPGANGQVATYGFSYQAVTQFLALAGALKAGTKRPDAIVPSMGGWDIRDDWAYTGGAFGLSGGLGWACQMGAEVARLKGDAEAYEALAAAGRGTPWMGAVAARPPVLERFSAYQHHQDWIGDDPGYWDRISPRRLLDGQVPAVPGLYVGGWQDFFLDGTLSAHAAFGRAGAPQRLIVGPWTHAPWGRRVGALDLGPEAVTDIDVRTVAFLDHVLKGRDLAGPAVRLFDVGTKSWTGFDAFPDPEPTALHLASDGRAATASTGRLVAEPEASGDDRLVHDPWRPAPAQGGAWGPVLGFQDRAALDDRSDVAVYDTAPLAAPLRLAGRVALEVHVATAAPSHDLHAVLSRLEPDGRAITLTAGYLRVTDAAAPGPRRVAMRALCCTLQPGQRLRLSIQAAAWPAFAVNPGTGARAEEARGDAAVVTTLALRHGADHLSRLLLPVTG